jgi:RND family efflux transporter MFP subunit
MRKYVVIGIVVLAVGGAAAYFGVFGRQDSGSGNASAGGPGGPASGARGGGGFGGGFGPGGFGGGPRMPMTVELGAVTRGDLAAHLTVVGNLIGEQTVDVAPKIGGRLAAVSVQLGDRVRRGQAIAKIEDREIVEQVRQAEASLEVSKATIRQREADLKVAEVNFDRSKNLYGRQLLSKQSLDDAESRYLAALAQLDLAKAQQSQTEARLEELRINLQNTSVVAPVDGFVGKRNVDPGAMVSSNTAIVSVVDIARLRLVANVIEKDLRMVNTGDPAEVEVDAYPGDKFRGRLARVAPVLDPATRTAAMEIEVGNPDYRLKPGMYARVTLTVEDRKGTLVAPKNAIVDLQNQRGVWVPNEDNRARFLAVELGIEDADRIEIKSGLKEGDRIVTSGATAVRNGDQLVIAGDGEGGPGGMRGGPGGTRGGRGGGQTAFEQGQRSGGGGRGPRGAGGATPGAQGRGQRPPQ